MSHFYSHIRGNKGPATRCGTKSSGITATATGWDIGGIVSTSFNQQLQTDVVTFTLTTGSNGHSSRSIASFAVVNGQLTLLNSTYPEIFI